MRRRLDNRLEAAAEMVRGGAVLADIGTDHGYLVCELVGSGKCPIAYACDINREPLMTAEKNIRLAGLSGKIATIRGDGLEMLEGMGINDFAILGMGGDLIAKIIIRQDWTRDKGLRFILQPMSKAEHLRRAVYKAGFALERERAVECGRFVYSVMQVCYTGEAKDISELFAWTGLLWNETNGASRLYLNRISSRLHKKADGLYASGRHAEASALYAELAEEIRRKADNV